jgi:hypothetical protein
MPLDIFGKNVKVAAGPLGRAETFEVYIGAEGSSSQAFVGLAQGVQNSYNQPLQRVYELGSFNHYMVSGRPIGTLSITRLVGTAVGDPLAGGGVGGAAFPTIVSLFESVAGPTVSNVFFKVDGSRGGVMTFRERTTGAKWICSGCYVTQESTGVDANGILVSEQIAIEYQRLEMETGDFSSDPNNVDIEQGEPLP